MKILQLMGHVMVGGTETFVISLVRGLIERGHDVMLVNTWTHSAFNTLAESSGVPFVRIAGGGRRPGPRWFWRVGRFLRQNRFDLVQTYGLRVSLALRMLQRTHGVRHHLTGVRGLDQQRSGLQARLDRRTEHLVDFIVCNAEAVASKRMAAVGTPRSRIRIIPNGIDLTRFSPDAVVPGCDELSLPEGFLFAHVASFRAEKDHENLLRAVKLAGDGLGDAKILLIGTGRQRDEVDGMVRQMGLADRVILTGPAEDVRPYLRACDAFVLSSFSEGMPRALMEAMAMGLPVVSTDAGGIAEVAENEKNALLVPTRSPEALAAALKRVVRDSALRERLGTAAVARIRDHFSHELMLDRHVALYESVLGGRDAL